MGKTGKKTVRLPKYFPSLTKEEEATVVLTPIGKIPFIVSYVWNEDHASFICYGKPESEISYIVLAERDDPSHRLKKKPVEQLKGEGNFIEGKYLHPEAYGRGRAFGVHPHINEEIE